MATLAPTVLTGLTIATNTELTLGASDTFVYDTAVQKSLLYLRNPTGGALTLTITGSTASAAIPVPGVGTVSAAGGFSTGSIAAGAGKTVNLDNIQLYLSGTITLSGAAGLVATFLKN